MQASKKTKIAFETLFVCLELLLAHKINPIQHILMIGLQNIILHELYSIHLLREYCFSITYLEAFLIDHSPLHSLHYPFFH
jgi:hypothetical protein